MKITYTITSRYDKLTTEVAKKNTYCSQAILKVILSIRNFVLLPSTVSDKMIVQALSETNPNIEYSFQGDYQGRIASIRQAQIVLQKLDKLMDETVQ